MPLPSHLRSDRRARARRSSPERPVFSERLARETSAAAVPGRKSPNYAGKESRQVVFFGRHGDLATVNFPHWHVYKYQMSEGLAP